MDNTVERWGKRVMITTINLNPCIDKNIVVSEFRCGQLNRVLKTRTDVSGKAVNVALAVKNLGGTVECLGFNYRSNGELLENTLKAHNIEYEFVWVKGSLRTNTKILDIKANVFTELNEYGGHVAKSDVSRIKQVINEHLIRSSLVVIGGSVPQGVSKSIYRDVLREASKHKIKTILDAEKELLLEGIKEKPYLIKPNLFELQTTFGRPCRSKEEIIAVAREIINTGVEIVCVSLGQDGAIIINEKEAFYSQGLTLDIQGVQGAGDSMVAGICMAMEAELPIEEMLCYGMAASAASLVLDGTQMCSEEGFWKHKEKIRVEKMQL